MIHAHSGLRWLVLIFFIISIVNAIVGYVRESQFKKKDKILNMLTLATFHLQVVIGFVLYILKSGKVSFDKISNSVFRFFTIEHPFIMLIAAVILTISYSKIKKTEIAKSKFFKTIIWFSVVLIIVLYAIPWTSKYGANMF